jgi:hypothetical protein
MADERLIARRRLLERLWAEGKSTGEIAAAMGWKPENAARYIAVYRARRDPDGRPLYDLPRRYSDEHVAAQRAGRRA